MKSLDLVLPAFILLLVSTWSSNASNLYSTVLTFSTVKTNWTYKKMTLLMGVLGIVLGLFGFSEYLLDFLGILGVFSPSITAIYIINFFWVKKQEYNLNEIVEWEFKALISWFISSFITVFTYFEIFQLSNAYFVDSFLIGFLLYSLLNWNSIKKVINFCT